MCSNPFNSTVTTQPSDQAQAALSQAFTTVSNTSQIPYTPYTGQLTAPLNAGQQTAIGQLQNSYGVAQPYIASGANDLNQGAAGLSNVQNYLQAGSETGANAANSFAQAGNYGQQSAQALQGMQPYMASANSALGQAGSYFGQAANYAAPVQFSQDALNQYLNPYTQDVINSTMSQLNQNDQVQASNVASSDIGSGAYGGDRNGIAQAALAGQQDMSNNSTVAGLNQANYSQAVNQFNQEQADRYQTAGIYSGLGQGSLQQASGYGGLATQQGQIAQQYGNLGTLANQTGSGLTGVGSLYGSLGSAQTQTGAAQGQLGALSGYLGSTAQGQQIAGASAGLQGSTLAQQYQQSVDAAKYGQFQNQIAYPFQTAGFLANAANGVAANLGSSTTQDGSLLSTGVGLATGALGGTNGLGVLNSLGTGLSNLVPNISNLGAGNNYGNANGGRVGFARGGNVGLSGAAQFASRGRGLGDAVHYARGGPIPGLSGLGGVNVLSPMRAARSITPMAVRHVRPRFAPGGQISFDPTNDPNALGGVNPGLSMPSTVIRGAGGGGAGGAGGAGGVGRAPSLPKSQGLGALSAFPSGGSGGLSGVPTTGATPSTDASSTSTSNGGLSNASLGLLAAGLGMMGGTSGNAAANIGQGGLEGLKTYLGLQQQDRANALQQQDVGFRQQQQNLENRKEDFAETQANRLYETSKQIGAIYSGQSAQVAGAIAGSGAGTGAVPASSQAPAQPGVGGAPAASALVAPAASAQAAGPAAQPLPGAPAMPQIANVPAPIAPAGAPPDASGSAAPTAPRLAPQGDPAQLEQMAQRSQNAAAVAYSGGQGTLGAQLSQQAQGYRQMAREIVASGKTTDINGNVVALPGATQLAAQQAAATTSAQEQAKNANAPSVDPATGAKYTLPAGASQQASTTAPQMDPAVASRSFNVDPETANVTTKIPQAPAGGGYIVPNLPAGSKLTDLPPVTQEQIKQDSEFLKDQVSTGLATDSAISRTNAIAQAFKTFQSGALADHQHDAAALATALGFPTIANGIMQGTISGPEWVNKEGVNSVLDTLRAATPRFAQSEFNAVANRGTPSTTNQPQANHEMVAEMLAQANRNKSFMTDWQTAKQQGWTSPTAFYDSWKNANPQDGFIKSAQRQIGNFAGMPLPKASDWAAGAVYVAPSQMPAPQAALLSKYGVQPGSMFRFNGRSANGQEIQPVSPSDAFSAQLGR